MAKPRKNVARRRPRLYAFGEYVRLLWPAMLIIVTLLAALYCAVERIDPVNYPGFTFVVVPLLTAICATFLTFVLGYEWVTKRISEIQIRRDQGPLLGFWACKPRDGFAIIYQGSSRETMSSVSSIRTCLQRLFGDQISVDESDAQELSDLTIYRTRNIIILGGHHRIPGLKHLSDALECKQDFQRITDERGERDRRSVVYNNTEYPSQSENGEIKLDYGMVTRVDIGKGQLVVWVSGNYRYGTLACANLVTDASELARVPLPDKQGNVLQFVVRADKMASANGGLVPPVITVQHSVGYDKQLEDVIFKDGLLSGGNQ